MKVTLIFVSLGIATKETRKTKVKKAEDMKRPATWRSALLAAFWISISCS